MFANWLLSWSYLDWDWCQSWMASSEIVHHWSLLARCPKCYYFPHIIQSVTRLDSCCHALKHQSLFSKSFQLYLGMSTYYNYILVSILSDVLLSWQMLYLMHTKGRKIGISWWGNAQNNYIHGNWQNTLTEHICPDSRRAGVCQLIYSWNCYGKSIMAICYWKVRLSAITWRPVLCCTMLCTVWQISASTFDD